jgi:type II secretory pathway pseudopilin PulG
MKFQISNFKFQIRRHLAGVETLNPQPSTLNPLLAFSLIEVLLAVTLLSFIILALMNVFSSTQQAFRASVTQSDVLEGGRAATQMIAEDLRGLTPSRGTNGLLNVFNNKGPYNFYYVASSYAPLVQSLPASAGLRTNFLSYFFILGRENQKWTGVGYAVNPKDAAGLYSLYRFYAETNSNLSPRILFDKFYNTYRSNQWTNMSHIINGAVHLTLSPLDPSGSRIVVNYKNILTSPMVDGDSPFYLYAVSNAIPAAVELQLGILEDRTLSRAESIPNATAQLNYLEKQSGHVHIFRQLVTIPNVDPSAYQ